jgi:hypothetical protein
MSARNDKQDLSRSNQISNEKALSSDLNPQTEGDIATGHFALSDLKAALLVLDAAQKALDHDRDVFGDWWQRDEPIRWQDRRAEEQLARERKKLVQAVAAAQKNLIAAARKAVEKHTGEISETRP